MKEEWPDVARVLKVIQYYEKGVPKIATAESYHKDIVAWMIRETGADSIEERIRSWILPHLKHPDIKIVGMGHVWNGVMGYYFSGESFHYSMSRKTPSRINKAHLEDLATLHPDKKIYHGEYPSAELMEKPE